MLWMKAWLETRWRLLYALGLPLAMLLLRKMGGLASAEDAHRMMGTMSVLLLFAAVYLAGAGIRTQSAFQGTQGLHGSTYFTLTLPVSRFRLLATRAGFGFLEVAGINVAVIVVAWTLFPLVRVNSTLLDMVQLILAAVVCIACFYCVSVVLATFLAEIWQVFGSLFVVGFVWWAVARLSIPPSVDVFRFMAEASPLVTHKLPWPAMAVSVIISAVLFFTALKIVTAREY
jgi:hypothetical protein